MANSQSMSDFTEILAMIGKAIGWKSACTVWAPPSTDNPPTTGDGQINLSDWADITATITGGLASIQCLKAPYSARIPTLAWELRLPDMTKQFGFFTVLLNGYFPLILQKYSVVIDGVRYDIKASTSDSLKVATWLVIQEAQL